MSATEAMSEALRSMTYRDQVPPCADGSNAWTSKDHEVRAKVAPHCDECSILHLCHDFADTARPRITFGIFAGIDYTTTSRTTT